MTDHLMGTAVTGITRGSRRYRLASPQFRRNNIDEVGRGGTSDTHHLAMLLSNTSLVHTGLVASTRWMNLRMQGTKECCWTQGRL